MNIRSFFRNLFTKQLKETETDPMKKFLIVGLGNIGEKYDETRHNIGFKIADAFVKEHEGKFSTEKLGDVAQLKIKGKTVFVLKPSTYMNLSGKAVKYWMQKEKILVENLLIITDDLNIDFGKLRIKGKGSSGGHNGLKDIQAMFNSGSYPRFRFGVGSQYSKGRQVDFVLGKWSADEESQLIERIPVCINAVTSFVTAGMSNTMNAFNGK